MAEEMVNPYKPILLQLLLYSARPREGIPCIKRYPMIFNV